MDPIDYAATLPREEAAPAPSPPPPDTAAALRDLADRMLSRATTYRVNDGDVLDWITELRAIAATLD